MGIRGFRRSISALAACLVAVALLGIPAPAQASGGGCSDNWAPEGWRFSACSHDNGWRVFADGYLDVVGDMRGATSCKMIVKLIDITNGTNHNIGEARADCYPHHLPTVWADMIAGHKYRTWVELERKTCCTIVRKVGPITNA